MSEYIKLPGNKKWEYLADAYLILKNKETMGTVKIIADNAEIVRMAQQFRAGKNSVYFVEGITISAEDIAAYELSVFPNHGVVNILK